MSLSYNRKTQFEVTKTSETEAATCSLQENYKLVMRAKPGLVKKRTFAVNKSGSIFFDYVYS